MTAVPCRCPVEGCAHVAELNTQDLGNGTYVQAHAAARSKLRGEHPDHPTPATD